MINAGSDPVKVIAGLKVTLATRGHERLLSAVLMGVARVLETRSTGIATVTVAKSTDTTAHKKAIAEALSTLGANDSEMVEDDTLIGGFIAEHNHTRIDNSYKSRLVNLYRSLTK